MQWLQLNAAAAPLPCAIITMQLSQASLNFSVQSKAWVFIAQSSKPAKKSRGLKSLLSADRSISSAIASANARRFS